MLLSGISKQNSRKKRWQYYDLAFGSVKAETLDIYESLFCQEASRSIRDVLELGCGTGRFLIAFGKRGYAMSGVDFDTTALALAREKCKEIGLCARLIKHDLDSWTPRDSYDAVISPNNTLKWLPNHDSLQRCITQAFSALRPGGIAIFDLTFEEMNWRSCNWGSEDELEEHAWVSKFKGVGIFGEYRCFYGMPNLRKGLIPFVERFICHDHSKKVILENRTTWLLFSAREFRDWVLKTRIVDNVKFYDKKAYSPSEIALPNLEKDDRQCLIVCRRTPCIA